MLDNPCCFSYRYYITITLQTPPLFHFFVTVDTEYALCAFYIFYERKICYNKTVAYPNLQRKGGDYMECIYSFILSILASVVAYYICKWLDRE